MANRWGNSGNSDRLYFGGLHPKSLQMVTAAMKLKDACSLEEKLWSTWCKVKSLSHVQLFVTPWTVAYQYPPSRAFSQQEYCSVLSFPSPGDLSNPGIEPRSPTWHADTLLSKPPGKPPRQHIKKQRHYFANKGPSSQSYGFSSGHVWMWELDYKESWAPKNWCFWTMVLKKTLESPLDSKEIHPVHPKGNQSWMFIGRTDAEAETPILWPPDAKNWLIWKDPDAGQDWRQEE